MVKVLQPVQTEAAAKILRLGGLLGLPTETVYGLAADAENEKAVARIYKVKGRPNDHPVIVHIAAVDQLKDWAREIPEYALKLGKAIWPGPLTLVLNRSSRVGDFISGGQDTVAVRVPNHNVALAVLREFGGAVAAPSANLFGQVSPTRASDVVNDLGALLTAKDAVIDGGDCAIGVESTIVDCTGSAPRILRTGAVTRAEVERITGLLVAAADETVRAPGTLASHYAPKARVMLAHDEVELREMIEQNQNAAVVAMASVKTDLNVRRLAAPATATAYAQVLYRSLRMADEEGLDLVLALPPQGIDVAEAVRDRLTRAAHHE